MDMRGPASPPLFAVSKNLPAVTAQNQTAVLGVSEWAADMKSVGLLGECAVIVKVSKLNKCSKLRKRDETTKGCFY